MHSPAAAAIRHTITLLEVVAKTAPARQARLKRMDRRGIRDDLYQSCMRRSDQNL